MSISTFMAIYPVVVKCHKWHTFKLIFKPHILFTVMGGYSQYQLEMGSVHLGQNNRKTTHTS